MARLYTDGSFQKADRAQFEGDYRLEFHLAPPLCAEKDPDTGHLTKRTYGPWMLTAFRPGQAQGPARHALDIFGYAAERKLERQLITDYERTVGDLLAGLNHDNHALLSRSPASPSRSAAMAM